MDVESSRLRLRLLDGTISNIDKIIDQNKLKIVLKPHQISMIESMLNLEKHSVTLENGHSLWSSMGICADCTGAGKSFEILGLISVCPYVSKREKIHLQFGNFMYTSTKNSQIDKSNIIVVPHSCIKQWEEYIKTFTSLSYKVIRRRKEIDNYNHSYEDIILVSSTMYNAFISSTQYSWTRVIFDEADTIAISQSLQPKCEFVWFITSSLQNLLFPSGWYFSYSQLSDRRIITRKYIDGIKRNGFIKDSFRMLERNEANNILKFIVLKNPDSYVKSSFELQDPIVNIIHCKTPLYLHVLHGIISGEIMQMLNAGNIHGAIEKTGMNVDTCENIVQSVTQSLETSLNNLELQKQCAMSMTYTRVQDKEKRIQSLDNEINRTKDKITSISERIRNYKSNVCPICIDSLSNPVTLNCCQNIFCFECLSRSLRIKSVCPMCRQNVNFENASVIDDTGKSSNTHAKLPTKEEALINIITTNKNGKFLVFSSHDKSFENINDSLNSAQINHSKLLGNASRISNTLNEYKHGDLSVLLLNTNHYGTGLNLENTTDLIFFHKMTPDMEKQVIGRAQRYGRTTSLRIHYLCQDNEL